MEYSNYQKAFFNHVKFNTKSAALISVAGSGKTTSLIEAVGYKDPFERVMLSCFNVATRDEFRKRGMAKGYSGIHYYNYNGFGNGILNRTRNVTMEIEKTSKVLASIVGKGKEYMQWKGVVKRLVSLAKNMLYYDLKEEDVKFILGRFGFDVARSKIYDFEDIVVKVYAKCLALDTIIDFDDQKFFPVKWDLVPCSYDKVFIDEYQDTSPLETELMTRAGKQIYAIGDPDQCIYGFKGAFDDNFSNFIRNFHADELFLSICYRCSEAVVSEAKNIVPRIESAPGASPGTVDSIKFNNMGKGLIPGDFVLCRVTTDLVLLCLRLLREGKKARVRGKNIGEGLIQIIDVSTDFIDCNIERFEGLLNDYHLRRIEEMVGEENEFRREELGDKVAAIKALWEGCSNTYDLKNKIMGLFHDGGDKEGYIDLMTIHKSKGLQAKNVYIIRPDLLPHPAAKQDWMRAEENRLEYVAITRAEENLFWVETKVEGK